MIDKEVKVQNLIIGAGLSGLSVAYYLGDDYLIIEKEDAPGGYCRTIKNKRYVWDYAGHFYHFRNKKYKDLFLSMVEPEEIIRQKKNTKIFYQNQLIDYPFQTNICELDKKEFIDCLYDLYFRDSEVNYDDFLGMLYAKFGRSITEKFLRPYNEKLYATDLRMLDKDAMGRFFPYADFEQVMRGMKKQAGKSYNDEFMYLKRGTGYFIDKLYDSLDKNKIRLNDAITSVDLTNKIAKTEAGEVIHFENLINTIPMNNYLKLLQDRELDKFAERLSYNKVLVFNLGFDSPSPKFKNEHWIYFPDEDLNFYRIGFYNNILGQNDLSVYVEIGYPKNKKEYDIEIEFANVIEGMKKVGIIDENNHLVDKNVLLMDPAYVHISTTESDEVEKMIQSFESQNVYMLGRYGRWTYNCMEDCIQLADELATRLKNR